MYARVGTGLCTSCRCGNSAGIANCAAEGCERRGRDDETAHAQTSADAGPAVLFVSVRSDQRFITFPYARVEGLGNRPSTSWSHDGLRRADVRYRCTGRGRQDSFTGQQRRRSRWRLGAVAQLRGPRIPVSRSCLAYNYADQFRFAGVAAGLSFSLPISTTMHIGFTYDLRADYLAAGYGEEETAEFDQLGTIEAIEGALCEIGHSVVRIGHVRNLVDRLAAGDRWDLVFNICEGLHGLGREAQVPAIL